MALSPDQEVQSLFVSALFYGLYLSTLFRCLRWLMFTDEGWKIRKRINWVLLAVTIAIWVFSTISKALEIVNTMDVVNAAKLEAPPPGSIGSTATVTWLAVVLCTDANLTSLLADAVLIYRCWIIYEKSRLVVLLPIFLWLGGMMLTGLQAYWQIVQSASILDSWRPINMEIGPGTVLTPFWGSTIVLNGYATFMIVRRIYMVSNKSKSSTSIHTLRFTMRVLIESGALYLATSIAHFAVWWTPNSYAISIVSNMNIAVIGIAFNLILIRVAQRRVEEDHHELGTHERKGPVSTIRFTPPANESQGSDTLGRISSSNVTRSEGYPNQLQSHLIETV